MALPEKRPTVLWRPLEPFQQPARPLDPSAADGGFAAVVDVIDGERGGHSRRRAAVTTLAVQRVCPLTRRKRGGRPIEPPLGPAKSFQRFGRLPYAERSPELLARHGPGSLPERGFARPLQVSVGPWLGRPPQHLLSAILQDGSRDVI